VASHRVARHDHGSFQNAGLSGRDGLAVDTSNWSEKSKRGKKCRKMKGLTVDLSFCFLFLKDENLRQKEKKYKKIIKKGYFLPFTVVS